MTIQRKVQGETIGNNFGPKDWDQTIQAKIADISERAQKAYQDERLKEIKQLDLLPDILDKSNILASASTGEVTVIDW